MFRKKVSLIWTAIPTVLLIALIIFHFANPFALIQVPDQGHRLSIVAPPKHSVIVEALRMGGLKPFRTFIAGGLRQTLMGDGITVIASVVSGPGDLQSAISLPSDDPLKSARDIQALLTEHEIKTKIWEPPEPQLKGKLYVVRVPREIGPDIAFRLIGRKMPWPKWEE